MNVTITAGKTVKKHQLLHIENSKAAGFMLKKQHCHLQPSNQLSMSSFCKANAASALIKMSIFVDTSPFPSMFMSLLCLSMSFTIYVLFYVQI